MRRANLLLLLVCLALIAGLLILAALQHLAEKPVPAGPLPAHNETAIALAAAPPTPARPALAPPAAAAVSQTGHPDAAAFGTPAIPHEREPELLLGFLEFFRREFGAFPSGNENPHFLNALAGSNPSGLVIFPLDHPRVSPDGELLDAWGTPFHFHSISRDHLEVRSAGPDKALFTEDDLSAPKHPGF